MMHAHSSSSSLSRSDSSGGSSGGRDTGDFGGSGGGAGSGVGAGSGGDGFGGDDGGGGGCVFVPASLLPPSFLATQQQQNKERAMCVRIAAFLAEVARRCPFCTSATCSGVSCNAFASSVRLPPAPFRCFWCLADHKPACRPAFASGDVCGRCLLPARFHAQVAAARASGFGRGGVHGGNTCTCACALTAGPFADVRVRALALYAIARARELLPRGDAFNLDVANASDLRTFWPLLLSDKAPACMRALAFAFAIARAWERLVAEKGK